MTYKKNCEISFRENERTVKALTAIGDSKGLDLSSVLRMMIHERLAADSDRALERYKKFR